MDYRSVKNRCAIIPTALCVSIAFEEVLTLLMQKGFRMIEVDIIKLARECIGTSTYRRGARFSEAPAVVDCSSFTKWLYANRGIWLPRRSIQQRELGQTVSLEELAAGDLVFVSGFINYYYDNPSDGVGHVGIATGDGTVIHAADSRGNVVESSIQTFIGTTKFRGAKRYIPCDVDVITLETPSNRDVETMDDIKWILLQSL